MGIILKSPQEIAIMQEAGEVVEAVLKALAEEARPGVKTMHLDDVAVDLLRKHGATASFLNYRGYPASVCISINEEVVHGIPGQRTLVEGDIVSLDFGAKLKGFHADAALTVGVGDVRPEAQEIIEVTRGALHAGIAAAKTGNRLGDISAAIQEYVESRGYSVVREWVGHGIGRQLHEDPQVPNFGVPGEGPLLQNGMTVALEPMVNAGGWRTRVMDNGWTVVTNDGGLSAHFEHTIAIGEDGAKILTGS
jgi:methionyl aminopeptidase